MKFYSILVIAITLTIIVGCGKKEAITKKIIKPVKYATVLKKGGEVKKSFNGISQSGSETRLSFRANGLITKLNAKVGDRVKKGQLLAQLDLNDLKLNYQKAKSSEQSSKSQLETAKSAFERVKKLYQANSASLSDYEQAKNGYLSAQSFYKTAKKSVELQKRQIEYAKIIAPTNGTISAVNGELNEFAPAGNPIIILNSRNDDIEVVIGVTENYISKISNGDETTVIFSGIDGEKFKGIVTEVGFSSMQNATAPVVLKLKNVTKQVRPGMAVEVLFSFGDKNEKSVLSVPISSVGQDHEGMFVYILEKKDKMLYKAKKSLINTGRLNNDGYEILSGVSEGQIIAIAGLRSLFDGMEVKLLD